MTRALLSRVAESIFWVGRYVERAEGTARILDVSVYQALEQSDVEGSHAARRLLAVMGLPDSGTETLWQATERLATDPASRSSIAGALAAARENTRAVRHVVPVEFWEHINATWAELPAQWEAGRRASPAFYLSFVKTQCAGMMGLADTMMSRDQTWLFFTLGRCLERTDVVARQLATVAFDEVFDSGLVMLLRSCGGYEPYLRLSQGVVEPGRVLDFLLRDRLFPRSAFASLTLAEECLDQINAGREGTWDDARGLVGLARAELEYSAPATLSRGLETRLERLQASISCGERRGHPALLRPGPARRSGVRGVAAGEPRRRMAAAGLSRDPFRLRRPGAGLLQRAAPHPPHRAAPDRARDEGGDDAGGARSTPTWITGAPTSWPSTSTAATRCSPSRATRWSTPSGPTSRTTAAGRTWPTRRRPWPTSCCTTSTRRPIPSCSEIAAGLRAERPLETARRIMATANDSLRYMRGVTSVHTSANEAYADGAGVCQDFAHLALALTKAVGLPSRYVSGYFHPDANAAIGEEITGESHAWVEVWTGTWWGYDPTNDCPVGERHVAVGRGRDYGDVPPVKGIYAGNAENTMRVVVRMTRTN